MDVEINNGFGMTKINQVRVTAIDSVVLEDEVLANMHFNITDEGLIIDVIDGEGEIVKTMSATYQDLEEICQ
jgi:hypothetical protein